MTRIHQRLTKCVGNCEEGVEGEAHEEPEPMCMTEKTVIWKLLFVKKKARLRYSEHSQMLVIRRKYWSRDAF